MNTTERIKPFGMYFEEILQPTHQEVIPIYDDELDLNIYFNNRGEKVIFVDCKPMLGTKTETRVQVEESDSDCTFSNMGTKTKTFVAIEETDDDDQALMSTNSIVNLSTMTSTAVAEEQSDNDDSYSIAHFSYFGTRTETKSSSEESDSDEQTSL